MTADATGKAEPKILVSVTGSLTGGETIGNLLPAGHPVWSPDGTKLAYVEEGSSPGVARGDTTWIEVVNADGSDPHPVSQPRDKGGYTASCSSGDPTDGGAHLEYRDVNPSWSADGTAVRYERFASPAPDDVNFLSVCESFVSNGTTTYTVNASRTVRSVPSAGGDGYDIYQEPDDVRLFAWSPDGNHALSVGPEGDVADVDLSTRARRSLPSTIPRSVVTGADYSPDGSKVAYVSAPSGDAGPPVVTVIDLADNTVHTYTDITLPPLPGGVLLNSLAGGISFTPDGNAIIYQQGDSLVERTLPDPKGDSRPDDPEVKRLGPAPPVDDPNTNFAANVDFDVQAQQLPIIFAPGFLGSEISCNGRLVWPPSWRNPRPNLDRIRLTRAGGNADCLSAKATGKILKDVLGSSITAHLQSYLTALRLPVGAGGGPFPVYFFGWDWRQRPQASMSDLQGQVRAALSQPLQKAEGATKVVLFGHSYGGLLIRTFLSEHHDEVARVLTEGTPYWGSPKVIFPLAFGVETPYWSTLDGLLNNAMLQRLARNLAGLYELFPSASYGPWLTDAGHAANVPLEVRAFGGNTGMYTQGQADHASLFDGFPESQLKDVDYRVIAVGGLETVSSVDIQPTGTGETADVTVKLGNGDQTVPLRSASWGGATPPDGVHIQIACGISHTLQPDNADLLAAYRDFLTTGRAPRKLPAATCSAQGALISFDTFKGLKLGTAVGGAASVRKAQAASGPINLAEAERAQRIDLLRLKPQVIAVLDDRTPTTLTFQTHNVRFTYTPVSGSHTGVTTAYGPVSGKVVLAASSTTKRQPVVRVNGRVVHGHKAPPAKCVVPQLKGTGLKQAKDLLANAKCRLGPVHRPKRRHSGRLVVVKQTPPPKRLTPVSTRVSVVLAYRK